MFDASDENQRKNFYNFVSVEVEEGVIDSKCDIKVSAPMHQKNTSRVYLKGDFCYVLQA